MNNVLLQRLSDELHERMRNHDQTFEDAVFDVKVEATIVGEDNIYRFFGVQAECMLRESGKLHVENVSYAYRNVPVTQEGDPLLVESEDGIDIGEID